MAEGRSDGVVDMLAICSRELYLDSPCSNYDGNKCKSDKRFVTEWVDLLLCIQMVMMLPFLEAELPI